MEEDDQERKGGINVPRQCYIAVPKAALLDAALSHFPSQAAAEDFRRFARCLDAVLHVEHKETLDQMCAYYMLPDEEQRGQVSCGNQSSSAAVNSKGSGLFGMAQDSDDDDDRMLFLSTGRLCSAYPRIPQLFLPPGLPSRPISSAPS